MRVSQGRTRIAQVIVFLPPRQVHVVQAGTLVAAYCSPASIQIRRDRSSAGRRGCLRQPHADQSSHSRWLMSSSAPARLWEAAGSASCSVRSSSLRERRSTSAATPIAVDGGGYNGLVPEEVHRRCRKDARRGHDIPARSPPWARRQRQHELHGYLLRRTTCHAGSARDLIQSHSKPLRQGSDVQPTVTIEPGHTLALFH